MKNKIQQILTETGRSQAYLCRELNKSANTISSWCRNKSQPSLIEAKKISDLLETILDELIIDPKADKKIK